MDWQEAVQETLEGAMERLDLVLGECVHQYQSSLVLRPPPIGPIAMLLRRVGMKVERKGSHG